MSGLIGFYAVVATFMATIGACAYKWPRSTGDSIWGARLFFIAPIWLLVLVFYGAKSAFRALISMWRTAFGGAS